MIELKSIEQANKAIQEGIVIGAIMYRCVYYNRACRSKQCFQYWEYGHLSTSCPNKERCGLCAEEGHNYRVCSNKSRPKKCAPCNGNHEAWSKLCSLKKKEIARILEAKLNTPRFYQTLNYRPSAIDPEGYTTVEYSKPSATRSGPSERGRATQAKGGARNSLYERPTPNLGILPSQSTRKSQRRALPTKDRIPLSEVTGNVRPRAVSVGSGKRRIVDEGGENNVNTDISMEEEEQI